MKRWKLKITVRLIRAFLRALTALDDWQLARRYSR
jgi:hypothetical protein